MHFSTYDLQLPIQKVWLPRWFGGKESACQCRGCRFDPWVRIPWRRKWQPTPVLSPGKSHGWRSLVGWSPWGCEESDMTERLHFHFSLLCIGEGNGTHSSILAWRIPGTEEPDRLYSMGCKRVRHNWANEHTHKHTQKVYLCDLGCKEALEQSRTSVPCLIIWKSLGCTSSLNHVLPLWPYSECIWPVMVMRGVTSSFH